MDIEKMTVEEFLKLHSPHYGIKKWYNYTEILIDDEGMIIPAVPSHSEALGMIWMERNNKSRDELLKAIRRDVSPLHWLVENLNVCSIWYMSGIMFPGFVKNKKVMGTINRLIDEDMLNKAIRFTESKEYSLALKRDAMDW